MNSAMTRSPSGVWSNSSRPIHLACPGPRGDLVGRLDHAIAKQYLANGVDVMGKQELVDVDQALGPAVELPSERSDGPCRQMLWLDPFRQGRRGKIVTRSGGPIIRHDLDPADGRAPTYPP